MLKAIEAFNSLVRGVVSLIVLGVLGAGGWWGYSIFAKERMARYDAEGELANAKQEVLNLGESVRQKTAEVELGRKKLAAAQEEIQRLAATVKLLKVDHRVAQIADIWQEGSAEKKDLRTGFTFVELTEEGHPMGNPRSFTVQGDVVYLDAWVVKFSDEYVEKGDPLRSTSICLFRRMFGESQPPDKGFELDSVGAQPLAYRTGGAVSDWEKELWSRFWVYANDAKAAKAAGVRAAHGEAPSIKLVPGKKYKILLRSSGGLSVEPEDAPVKKGATPVM